MRASLSNLAVSLGTSFTQSRDAGPLAPLEARRLGRASAARGASCLSASLALDGRGAGLALDDNDDDDDDDDDAPPRGAGDPRTRGVAGRGARGVA